MNTIYTTICLTTIMSFAFGAARFRRDDDFDLDKLLTGEFPVGTFPPISSLSSLFPPSLSPLYLLSPPSPFPSPSSAVQVPMAIQFSNPYSLSLLSLFLPLLYLLPYPLTLSLSLSSLSLSPSLSPHSLPLPLFSLTLLLTLHLITSMCYILCT